MVVTELAAGPRSAEAVAAALAAHGCPARARGAAAWFADVEAPRGV